MNQPPSVSAIMVAANEPCSRLQRAITSLAAQGTGGITELVIALPPLECAELERTAFAGIDLPIRVVLNPGGQRASGLNLAARTATGEILVRLDARCSLPPEYVERCVRRLQDDADVGVVGGVQSPTPGGDTVAARGIGRALSNPWALGGAGYRVGRTGPADTVYLGVFRRNELLSVGGWDERLLANEDYELCARYRRGGAAVWVEGDLAVQYLARTGFTEVFRQYRAFGSSKVAYWRLTGRRPAPRQLVALLVAAAASSAALTLAVRRPARLTIAVPLVMAGLFALDHVGVQEPATPAQRAAAVVGYGTIWSSWILGIVDELLLGRWR